MNAPAYLQPPPKGALTYGTVDHDPEVDQFVVRAHPAALDLAKRLFPGSAVGKDKLAFKGTRRAVADLNLLLLRYPMEISCKDRYEALRLEAIEHANRRDTNAHAAPLPAAASFAGKLIEPYQPEGVGFLVRNKRGILADDMGLGKALASNTRVLTPRGWQLIGDLRRGDKVIGSDGRQTTVTGVYPQGMRPLYRVKFSDGAHVLADAEHLWAVNSAVRKARGCPNRIVTTAQMMAEGLRDAAGNCRFYIPIAEPAELASTGERPVDPYLLGLLLGDGGMTTRSVRYSTVDAELLEAVAATVPLGVSVRHDGGCNYHLTKGAATCPNSLVQALKRLNLMGKGSHQKFVPSSYLFAPRHVREAVLAGLLDTDGTIGKDGCVQFDTCSDRLASAVVFLTLSLGGVARERFYDGRGWRITINMPRCPFRLKRKADRFPAVRKYLPARAVTSIEPVGEGHATCISVDAPDQLFVIDHFIVTHNTVTALAALATANAFPALVVVPPALTIQWMRQSGVYLRLPNIPPDHYGTFAGRNLCRILKGNTPRPQPPKPITICHYLQLKHWRDWLLQQKFKAVIFDEIQELRHAVTDKYSAASIVAQEAEYVWGLSGTPIYNYGNEIWAVTNIIEMHCLGSSDSFSREWCTGYGEKIVRDPAALGDYLKTEGLMLRRTKDQVQSSLPPKRRVVVNIEKDNEVYRNAIQRAVELSRRYQHLKDFVAKGQAKREIDQLARQATGIAKAPHVAAFVQTLLDAGERVLVYAHHHAVHGEISRRLKDFKPVMITGQQSQGEKDAAVKTFAQGNTNLIQLAIRGAAGIDGLQGRGTCVVFAELDWSPAVHAQDEDRIHRIGFEGRESLLCYYLVSDAGSDEVMQEALGLKVAQFTQLMGDKGQSVADQDAALRTAERHIDSVIEKLRKL